MWEKIKPDQKQVGVVLSQAHLNSYIMQNLSENYFMGKVVLQNYANLNEVDSAVYSEDRQISMKQRADILSRQIDFDFTQD